MELAVLIYMFRKIKFSSVEQSVPHGKSTPADTVSRRSERKKKRERKENRGRTISCWNPSANGQVPCVRAH